MSFHGKQVTLVHKAAETGQRDVPWLEQGRHIRRRIGQCPE
ncbi:MAG: hypothetical protein ACPHJ3_13340 [Rubripirellula sp.]